MKIESVIHIHVRIYINESDNMIFSQVVKNVFEIQIASGC